MLLSFKILYLAICILLFVRSIEFLAVDKYIYINLYLHINDKYQRFARYIVVQYYEKRRHDGYVKLWRRFDNFFENCMRNVYSTYRNRDVIIYQHMLSITEGRQRIAAIHLLDKGNFNDKRRSHKVYNALQIQ